MTTYYNSQTGITRDFDETWFNEMTEAGNPKVSGFVVRPDPPSHDSATQHPAEWVDGEWVIRDKTPEELAAEARKVWSNSASFWAEFTNAEKLDIIASTTNGIILLREELRLWIGEVWSDDSRVQDGLNGLVSTNILTEERKTQILNK
jgi:hypothetical protein